MLEERIPDNGNIMSSVVTNETHTYSSNLMQLSQNSDSVSSVINPVVENYHNVSFWSKLKLLIVPTRIAGYMIVAPFKRLIKRKRSRSSWNSNFQTWIDFFRYIINCAPDHLSTRDIQTIRGLASIPWPKVLLPKGVHRYKERVSLTSSAKPVKCEWLWSSQIPILKDIPVSKHGNFLSAVSSSLTSPVILYIHGGAFCVCSTTSHRGLMMRLSQIAGCPVYAPNYRLCPEASVIGSVEDVIEVYNRMILEYKIAASKIVFAGDSAGGALVCLALVELKKKHLNLPVCAVLLSPWVDLNWNFSESHPEDAEGIESRAYEFDYITQHKVKVFSSIAAGKIHLDDPLISVINADLHGLPPILVHAGQCEVLLSQIKRFSEKLKTSGVDVTFKVFPDMVHVFQMFSFCHETPECSLQEIRDFIKSKFSPILQQ